MNQQQFLQGMQQLANIICADAVKRLDAISPVRRVVVKLNPGKRNEFVFMALLTNEQRYEGSTIVGERRLDWCMTPNCQCKSFIKLKSPVEVGVTIDD